MQTQIDERTKAEFIRDKVKWKIRRRFAIASFVHLVFLSIYYVIGPYFMSKEIAEIAEQFNGVVVSLIGCFTSVVMLYVGAVTWNDNQLNKKND